ncbi:MAG: hypothetical protein IJ212_02775 [Bacteroidaceae bacterium]|nr:hypothetical protein [Bacteroidaceae bacterium]
MEKKFYESPKLTVEEFVACRNYVAACGTTEIDRITVWPLNEPVDCVIDGADKIFADASHTKGGVECTHCVTGDCTKAASGYFGYVTGGQYAANGYWFVWEDSSIHGAGGPPSDEKTRQVDEAVYYLKNGSMSTSAWGQFEGWHGARLEDSAAIIEYIMGWSGNH